MSVSSCPRCAQQVTLPVGVSNSARVRCPHCHAQYTLADALVNMPPLLEVIDHESAESGLDWLDEESASDSNAAAPALGIAAEPDLNLDDALDLDDEPKLAAAVEAEEELQFDAVEMDHDDADAQEQDTEVEELAFTTSDAPVRPAPTDDEPVEVAAANDDDFLDFGSEVAKHEPDVPAETDLGSLDENVSLEEEIAFDFEEQGTAENPTDDVVSFDFEEEAAAAESGPQIDELGLPVRAVVDDEEPIELDFGEAEVDPAATIDFSEEPETKGKKKKKAKAPKAAKVKAPQEPGERSLVGTLLTFVLAALVAIPLALYGALWISADYDFIGLRKWLPSAMLPAAKPARTLAQAPPALPPAAPADAASAPPAEPTTEAAADDQPPADAAAAPQEPAETSPATEAPVTEAPAADAPVAETPANTTPPESAPAEPLPVEPQLVEPQPAEPAATTPAAEPPAAEPAQEPALVEETPAAPAADKPEEPLADPFAEPSPPAAVAEPKEEAAEPKEVMPADDAPAATDDPADPFAEPAPTAEPPAADATPDAAAPEAPPEPEEPLGPRNVQTLSPEEIAKAAQEFGAADQRLVAAMASADKNEVKKARAGFFLSLYRFADVLAAVNREPFENQPADFQQGMRQLARDTNRLKELGAYAAKWLAFGKRTTPGVVLAGKVEAAEQVGKLYHTTVKLTDDAPSVEIVSHNDPGVAAGDEVIVLGTIVQQPDEQLAGYEGTAPQVVWSGVTFNTKAAEK